MHQQMNPLTARGGFNLFLMNNKYSCIFIGILNLCKRVYAAGYREVYKLDYRHSFEN